VPGVLVIEPLLPPSLQGRHLLSDRLTMDLCSDAAGPLAAAAERVYDLLVLAGMDVEEQQDLAGRFQQHRRWRLVPVLYVMAASVPGFAIPAGYRPEMDGLVRGSFDSPAVERRIRAMAREGISEADMVVAGPFELDPVRGRLRLNGIEILLTGREAEIVAILLAHSNRTVSAGEIIERGWGAGADPRYLQILRRHVSNIRRKLEQTPAARSVRTVRGNGYRFDTRIAS